MAERFGAYARRMRLRAEVSIKDVAEALGFSSVYVSDIERGNRNPPEASKVHRWAQVIGVEPEAFVNLADLERQSVELRVGGDVSYDKSLIGIALARAWEELTPQEEAHLKEALANRLTDLGVS